ncbi:DUF2459 domain-containing protein [Sulfurimonas sp. HSL3-7]|uniref:DUF2459 domain-containing protein n=1 Tax=Sulfonitrofixus jiaomeiensis TaxID=3131938 RepID=UPI0031F89F42
MESSRYLQGMLIMLVAFSTILLTGCAKTVRTLYPPNPDRNDNKTVYVVNNYGWHTGIVLSRKDAAPYLHAFDDFKSARYLEIGWGDELYYQAKKITFWMSIRAAFWPTDSVLHVVALQDEPLAHFSDSDVVALELSNRGFIRLVEFIDNSFALDEKGEIITLGSGLYGTSRFYRAEGTFHLFNNCNTWSADAIRSSGFPISTFYVFSSDNMMYQLKQGMQ